jgi:hypothetical protein
LTYLISGMFDVVLADPQAHHGAHATATVA